MGRRKKGNVLEGVYAIFAEKEERSCGEFITPVGREL
jgi:hypothetical protein